MPKPTSIDLRQRIVEAYLAGEGTYAEIAARFGVGEATVSRMLRRERERGDLKPKAWAGGPTPTISDDELSELRELVAATPDGTLDDFCDGWEKLKGVRVSRATMGRTVRRAGLTRKRKRFRPSEQQRPDVEEKRESFVVEVQSKDPERLVFLDESGCNIAMAPSYGWAPRGEPVVDYKPANWGKNVTMVAAITLQGVIAHDNFEGAMNTPRFLAFLDDKLCPALLPGDVVVMDNLRPHHAPGVRELVEASGADLLYLPPYSPDLNPIELMWSSVKHFLRKARVRCAHALASHINRALEHVNFGHFGGWFEHCGYPQPS